MIMLMGLVAQNAILLLDATRRKRPPASDREEALMHAVRKRSSIPMMTTFALIAGMMPVAIGVGRAASSTAHGRGHHRRHHHLDAADAAGRPDLLRQPSRSRVTGRLPSSAAACRASRPSGPSRGDLAQKRC